MAKSIRQAQGRTGIALLNRLMQKNAAHRKACGPENQAAAAASAFLCGCKPQECR
jgi:hypothetical protein